MSESKQRVDAIITEHLGVEPDRVVESANLIDDLAADSLDVVELVMAFEEEFEIEIPDDETEKMNTVGDCYTIVEAKLAAKSA